MHCLSSDVNSSAACAVLCCTQGLLAELRAVQPPVEPMLSQVQKLTADVHFTPELVGKVAPAGRLLCEWLLGLVSPIQSLLLALRKAKQGELQPVLAPANPRDSPRGRSVLSACTALRCTALHCTALRCAALVIWWASQVQQQLWPIIISWRWLSPYGSHQQDCG